MASSDGVVASNKQVIFKDYVSGFPKESDMEVKVSSIKLKLPEDSNGILVKNLYLSCDPYMRILMNTDEQSSSLFSPYSPGSAITGFGVFKVVDSKNPNFKEGDLAWGTTGWEEYSIITATQGVFKIGQTDIPLSYYTELLGCLD